MSIEISELFESKSWFIEKHFSELEHPLANAAQKLALVSDYACKHIQTLKNLLVQDECTILISREEYFHEVKKIALDLAQANYMRELRIFRNTHFLRLLLMEYAGIIKTEIVMRAWSDCADAIILHALSYCQQSLSQRYGVPHDTKGKEATLLTLAMGKLGGRELNYSSDIDLIFAYSAVGETDGKEGLDNQSYFNKAAQLFSQILQNITAEGFVFRVDLRLRPNGESGTLVPSLSAMETYYQEQGRDWERYAMIKARVISETVDAVHPWFERLIIPFVYRRYVDFSVIESLRSMKAMIEREVRLNPRLDDIKRGKGGIREVEFIIQNFQLIRGGRLPQLQLQNTLAVLAILKRECLLTHSGALKQAYLFLRQLENVVQSLNDQQTHSLPKDPLQQAQVTLAMGFPAWKELLTKLHQYQRIISFAFHAVMGKTDFYEDEKRMLANQLISLWQGHIETNMSINLLSSLEFDNAERCYQLIHAFCHGPRCRRLPQGARMRLDRFMVLLLTELAQVKNTDEILLQVVHLLDNIVGRSAYLALLTENPPVLVELLFWFAHSPFITSLLVNQPFLLEVLLDQGEEWHPLSRQQLEKSLREQLALRQDVEAQEEILRQFKLSHWLMAARAELYGFSSSVRIGKFLSDVAQVIVNQVLLLSSEQLAVRYPEMKRIQSHFAIIAYGKLGSREMNYASDLDLVFLHSAASSDEALVTRLTQKILHSLTTRSQSGVLYAVDTRLRPSGSAGLLVSHIDAFIEYQKNQAWTWEHQALLKARIVTVNSPMQHAFLQMKKEVLAMPRNQETLQKEIVAMRSKIDQYHEIHHLKHVAGGLLDLEFLVQFLVLNLGQPSLARSTHTLNQLNHLFAAGVINMEQLTLLKKAYQHYHYLLHMDLLCSDGSKDERFYQQVAKIYRYFLF
ncbi:MAG: bifunctional [glutamate--ammonia ligase]-adenylyl-L-tyrosine phosphorylase/[glutamate--ammonia-ligase] adenylyltransferase [Legionella sp.]|uniref:bifunctional [glutamate--ammonia ligase]-adenylyl-L-tyrosine phosphorylase/[glutamate--ammonia-ligase] adenylyltransferase n=1 Tax=Legionella sp. TaxID=459 RepID=UPI0039E58A27